MEIKTPYIISVCWRLIIDGVLPSTEDEVMDAVSNCYLLKMDLKTPYLIALHKDGVMDDVLLSIGYGNVPGGSLSTWLATHPRAQKP